MLTCREVVLETSGVETFCVVSILDFYWHENWKNEVTSEPTRGSEASCLVFSLILAIGRVVLVNALVGDLRRQATVDPVRGQYPFH